MDEEDQGVMLRLTPDMIEALILKLEVVQESPDCLISSALEQLKEQQHYTKLNKIHVFVEGGIVQDVYREDGTAPLGIQVVVTDVDHKCDDPENEILTAEYQV